MDQGCISRERSWRAGSNTHLLILTAIAIHVFECTGELGTGKLAVCSRTANPPEICLRNTTRNCKQKKRSSLRSLGYFC